jgi:hypothetical protein
MDIKNTDSSNWTQDLKTFAKEANKKGKGFEGVFETNGIQYNVQITKGDKKLFGNKSQVTISRVDEQKIATQISAGTFGKSHDRASAIYDTISGDIFQSQSLRQGIEPANSPSASASGVEPEVQQLQKPPEATSTPKPNAGTTSGKLSPELLSVYSQQPVSPQLVKTDAGDMVLRNAYLGKRRAPSIVTQQPQEPPEVSASKSGEDVRDGTAFAARVQLINQGLTNQVQNKDGQKPPEVSASKPGEGVRDRTAFAAKVQLIGQVLTNQVQNKDGQKTPEVSEPNLGGTVADVLKGGLKGSDPLEPVNQEVGTPPLPPPPAPPPPPPPPKPLAPGWASGGNPGEATPSQHETSTAGDKKVLSPEVRGMPVGGMEELNAKLAARRARTEQANDQGASVKREERRSEAPSQPQLRRVEQNLKTENKETKTNEEKPDPSTLSFKERAKRFGAQ